MTRYRLLAVPLLLLSTSSCASWSGVRFAPSPFEVAVAPDPEGPALGSAVFSWRGIEGGDAGYEAHFHARVQNDTDAPLWLDPDRCTLVDGALFAFEPPYIVRLRDSDDGPDWSVPPGGAVVWSLSFPFPEGGDPAASDLSALHLTLGLSDDRGGINVSASFDRLRREHDGGWSGSVFYGTGWHVRGGSDGGLGVSLGTRIGP